ncbi:MAG: CRISPR-associated endonuclease Cas1 [Bacteroidia bacterium]
MDLFITSLGARLTCKKGMFQVKNETDLERLSPGKISSITLTRACMVSTDAFRLAIKYEIPIILVSGSGKPLGRLWSNRYGSIPHIRRRQLAFSGSPKAMNWMAGQMHEKTQKQLILLTRLHEQSPENTPQFTVWIDQIRQHQAQFQSFQEENNPPDASGLRGIEGKIARTYFQALSTTLPPTYQFDERSRHPSKDRFNAALNYLYGMLYNLTETALIAAGLDPYLPVFHSDKRNKPALVYDIVEVFRPWADWVVVRLCQQRDIPQTMTQPHKGGLWLNEEGRKVVIEAFQNYLNRKVQYGETQQKRRRIIYLYCQEFAQSLLHHDLD